MYKKISFEDAIKRIKAEETVLVRSDEGSLFPVDDVEDNLISFSKYDYYREVKLKDCINCGSDAVMFKNIYDEYVVKCSSCGSNYSQHKEEICAVNIWNEERGE